MWVKWNNTCAVMRLVKRGIYGLREPLFEFFGYDRFVDGFFDIVIHSRFQAVNPVFAHGISRNCNNR